MISPQSIENLAGKIDFVVIAQKYARGKLIKTGTRYKCLSPFTNEKTSSCYFDPEKGFYKDFSSGKGGDAIDFIMEIEGVEYLDAIRILADLFDVKLEETKGKQSFSLEGAKALNDVFVDALKNDPKAKEYVLSRFGSAAVKKFGLGLYVKDVQMKLKKDIGILWDKDSEKMVGRITFPIKSRTGQIRSFFARTLTDGKPKYLGGHNTDFYQKSETLYGLFENSLEIRKRDEGYIVEGQPDVISMFRYKYPSVSAMGTSMSDQQISQALRLTSNWILLFDGDSAGQRAATKVVGDFAKRGIEIKVAVLNGEDPDEHLRKHGELKIDVQPGFDFLFKVMDDAEALGKIWEYLIAIRDIHYLHSAFIYLQIVDRFGFNKNVNNITWSRRENENVTDSETLGLAQRWQNNNE